MVRSNVAFGARTIFVPTDFPTIQDAINNAADGDSIYVFSGTYTENLFVNKAVSLVGENKTTTSVDGGGLGLVFNVTVNNVSISGFTVKNGVLTDVSAGILLYKVRFANVSDNIVFSSYKGIELVNSSFNNVQSNYVTECNMSICLNLSDSNTLQENTFSGANVAGIYARDCSNNTIDGNTIINAGIHGIYLSFSPHNNVLGNGITGCNNGLTLESSGRNTLAANDINSNMFNLGVNGGGLDDFIQDISISNKVDGRSVYYLVNSKSVSLNGSLSDVGYLAVVNSSNVRVSGLRLSGNNEGFLCAYSTDCVIESSNIVNNEKAAFVYYSPRCTIVNDTFFDSTEGITFISAANALVRNCSITNANGYGLRFESSDYSVIERNLIRGCAGRGLNLYSSRNCNISGNTFAANGFGILVQVSNGARISSNAVINNTGDGIYFSLSDNCLAESNNVTGNAGYGVFFLNSQVGTVVNNYVGSNTESGVYLYTSNHSQVNSNVVDHNDDGINLYFCPNSSVRGNKVVENTREGVFFADSPNAIVLSNFVCNNGWNGIVLQNSGNSSLSSNIACSNAHNGLWLQDSSYMEVLNCNFSSNIWDGLYLRSSNNTRILNSTINMNGDSGCRIFSAYQAAILQTSMSGNANGLRILVADNNNVSDNVIMQNLQSGIEIFNSTGNTICGNRLINNTQNVKISNATGNAWDNGYPSGGNYWSNYAGSDSYWGPEQNQLGSDGIIDLPYVIDLESRDRYPFVTPSRYHDLTIENVSLPASEVYVGWVFPVNITVKNSGWYVENANMTVYCETSPLGTRIVSNLTVSQSLMLSVTWNTSNLQPGHAYDVKANVSAAVGEAYVEDNVYDFGVVKIKMVGDVNNDGKISILDIVAVATAFGSKTGQPHYKLNYDMNLDYMINIIDITMAAGNYGKTYP